MFSLFKRRTSSEPELTFQCRVQRFWAWFTENSSRLHDAIESRQIANFSDEVRTKVDELGPGFAWVFGPGENGKGHSFTLSGEGVLHHQLLALYWESQKSELAGWAFYASRQPGSIDGFHMEIGGKRFDPTEFWLVPIVNLDSEKLDLTVWHPLFDKLEERHRWSSLFLFLDEVLGEYGTQQWVGEIKLNEGRLTEAIPLRELPEFLKRIQAEMGWKKLPLGQGCSMYNCHNPHDRFLRGDVLTGTTINLRLINEYVNSEGELADPVAGTGAHYVFVSFDAKILPQGQQAAARGVIEDDLNTALETAASGRLLGGAFGIRSAYIDLLLFAGDESLSIVKRVLQRHNLPPGSAINYFAKEKRRDRILL